MGILSSLIEDPLVIKDCGNGVYLFECWGSQLFATGLSKFIGEHHNLRVVAIADIGNSAGNYAHVVVTEKIG